MNHPEMVQLRPAPAIESAAQKLRAQRGLPARVAEWLVLRFGIDQQRAQLKDVDAAIAEAFRVSPAHARRWRSGWLPPARYLESMRRRWGMEFVLFIFGEFAQIKPNRLAELVELDDRIAAYRQAMADAVRRQEHLLALSGDDAGDAGEKPRFRIADPQEPHARLFAELVEEALPQDAWSQAVRGLRWAWIEWGVRR